MKIILKTALIISIAISLTGCLATFSGQIHPTYVELKNNNFRIVKNVTGYTQATYILGIGGSNKTELIHEAKRNMYNAYELKENQTYYNITHDVTNVYVLFPIYYQKRVYISADVIEIGNSMTNLDSDEVKNKTALPKQSVIEKIRLYEKSNDYSLKLYLGPDQVNIGDIVKLNNPYLGQNFAVVNKIKNNKTIEVKVYPENRNEAVSSIKILDVKKVVY